MIVQYVCYYDIIQLNVVSSNPYQAMCTRYNNMW